MPPLSADFSRIRRRAAMAALLFLAALLAVSGAAPALAQTADGPAAASTATAPGTGDEVETERLRDLVATLEDDAARAAFLDRLRTALEARAATREDGAAAEVTPSLGARALAGVTAALGRASRQVAGVMDLAGRLPEAVGAVIAAFDSPRERAALLLGLARGTATVAVGLLGFVVARRLLRRPRLALTARRRSRWLEREVLLVGRLVLVLVPPLATVAAAWGVLPLLHARPETQTATIVLVVALATVQAIWSLTETLFRPDDEHQRALPIGGETAHYLLLWSRRLALVSVVGYFTLEGARLLGLPPGVVEVLQTLLGLLLAAMVIILIFQNRQAVATWMRRGTGAPPPGETRRRIGQRLRLRLAEVWHVLAALYVAGGFVIWAAEVPGGFLFVLRATAVSALVVVAALVAGHLLEQAVRHVFRVSEDAQIRYPGLEKRANRYVPVLASGVRGLLWMIAGLTILQAWGLDVLVWLTAGGGQRLTSAVATIALVLLGAAVVWELISSKIERYFSETDDDGNVIERSARAKTLLPLARNVLLIGLVVVVALIILSEIGLNIAPLLAGAGVVGLAIGFGSQKLVQDVITGAFILFEDTMSVGDVVQVAGHGGLVEGLTIRSLRLRDLSGNVHTIPFSSVDTITNMTKDFSYYLFDVGVAYREDTDEVAAILVEIGDEMQAEPYFGALILEPLEILGVDSFGDSAVVLKARIKTRPIKQWEVGREFNRRMKKAFDARDIEIPFPHTTLYFGIGKDGTAPPARLRIDDRPRGPGPELAPPTALPDSQQTSDTPAPGDGD
jgi:small conductance mechanosensitive channel